MGGGGDTILNSVVRKGRKLRVRESMAKPM